MWTETMNSQLLRMINVERVSLASAMNELGVNRYELAGKISSLRRAGLLAPPEKKRAVRFSWSDKRSTQPATLKGIRMDGTVFEVSKFTHVARVLRSTKLKGGADQPMIDAVMALDNGRDLCRWPIGEPGDKDFHFCCMPTGGEKSYCLCHHSMAFASDGY